MAINLKETTATSALNQDDYINKLYDKRQQSQQDIANQDKGNSESFLNGQSDAVRNQTSGYVDRTNVESQKAAQQPTYPRQNLSYGAAAQQGLSRGNQQQKDLSALTGQQNQAEAEIQRQRQQLAQYYQTEIQRATAENDMQRAQQLYDAAKAEEKQLQALRQEAAVYAKQVGNKSILESIANGDPVQRDTTSATLPEVLQNEGSINKIYDANMQAQQLQLQQDRDAAMSDLEAKQRQAALQTDQSLNSAYTAALQKARASAESQTAYGMGSGTAAQAGLSRELGLQQDLTELRRLQLGKDAQSGMDSYGLLETYNKELEKANSENELKRAQALYKSAEEEENNLVAQQKWLAEIYAKDGDKSVLEKLYGLPAGTLKRRGGGNGVKGREPTGIPALDYGTKGGGGSGGSSGGAKSPTSPVSRTDNNRDLPGR